jgi:hypothetical protein
MPDTLTLIVAAAMLVLAIAWFVIISRALSDKTKVESFFFGSKTPKDPV